MKIKTELLPKGRFVLYGSENGADTRYRGRFSLYAIDRFCQLRSIDNYFDLIERISAGMSLGDYGTLVQVALNDYSRDKNLSDEKTYSQPEAMDIIDDVFEGLEDAEFIALIRHAVGRIAKLPDAPEQDATPEDTEKKSSK